MSSGSWDYTVFWNETMNQIRSELSEQEYSMWFNRMEYAGASELEIIVSVPSSFYRDQVRQRYLSKIEEKLFELSGTRLHLEFSVNKSASAEPAPFKRQMQAQKNGQHPAESTEKKRVKPPHSNLKDEYNFDNFVIGANNSFAANAAMAIAKNPGTGYNPCLIYGGVGLGKTHLIQSIGNQVYHEFDNLKIVYVTMESFTNEFIQSIREKKTHLFKNKYRYADVLLIDDIHFLQKKTETQEELFHTFNALYDANKQMVFTCDRPVSELKELTDRLRSRFERGLNVDLQPPSFETRYAILKKKIERSNIDIPEQVIELICNNVTTNVRDLEAALTKLVAYADLVNKNITLEIAQQQLKDFFASPKQSNVTMDVIQRTVADYFNLSANDLKGKKRTKVIAFPRQLAMYIAREITEFSTTEVGLEFGGRDHTTVMHAYQRIENRMRTDPTLEPTVQFLIRSIKDQSTRS
jgi:chromosomal replication initiator protein